MYWKKSLREYSFQLTTSDPNRRKFSLVEEILHFPDKSEKGDDIKLPKDHVQSKCL